MSRVEQEKGLRDDTLGLDQDGERPEVPEVKVFPVQQVREVSVTSLTPTYKVTQYVGK